jgi:hypothetical protein
MALKVLLASDVTLGKLSALRVLALALPLAAPIAVMDNPFTVVAVELALLLVKVKAPRVAPLVLDESAAQCR